MSCCASVSVSNHLDVDLKAGVWFMLSNGV